MSDSYSNRQIWIRGLFIFTALVLAVNALYIQLIDSTYRQKAEATTIDEYVIYPSRGVIYDRNDRLLVHNDPTYDLMVTYNQVSKKMDTLAFCELLGITRDYFEKTLEKNWRDPRYSKSVPFVFVSKVSAQKFAQFQERLYEFPGFSARLRHARGYPHTNAAHVIGYIREVDQADINKNKEVYASGDYIGAGGLESAYEALLKGEKGSKLMLKDNLGREVGFLEGSTDLDPVSGNNLTSSLDLELQAYGELLMQNKIGSIVAIEPATGEVLAMVSTPNYDPNELSIDRERGEAYKRLVEDPNLPLFDRSIMAQYPPGSLFKPIIALIGLETGAITPEKVVSCPGAYFFGGMRLTGCHGHPTCYNVQTGIQYSCNAYFVTVFRDIVDKAGGFYNPQAGLDIFNSYLDQFNVGKVTGIDIPREKGGFYPSSEFYNQHFGKQQAGQKWNSIWIRSLGIGQGELLLTNLQMANLAAIIANRGHYYRPHLIKAINGDEKAVELAAYKEKHEINIQDKYFELVIDGMEQVVQAGTARVANIPGVSVCGKTGTAENPHGEDHSIFFAFAPKYNPEIAIAVYVENAGFGGVYAAPIASLMIEKYINGSIDPTREYLEKRMLEANLMPILP
ncbi:MAG TPA: penicillin-binding protein 2 [Saprospiraceae bacterium]|nr:penicillin-binding protein 2 [Saprospiraceae bacterium]HMQ82386.1 penicillin-binding protein 2 [Saprospiraceae bacterium]